VLGGVGREEIERLAPSPELGARVPGSGRPVRFGREALQLFGVDQAMTRGTREQRRSDVDAALGTTEGSLPGSAVSIIAPA